MPAYYFVIAGLFPFRGADEVLGFEQGVAEDVGGGGHGYVVVCGEGFPDFVEEGAVVYAHGWGDALAEAGPVLRLWGLGGSFMRRGEGRTLES